MSGKGKDYRPICDTWLLAPSKVGYYGAYPNGFLQRARCLLCRMGEPMLHVCSGKVTQYPGYGFGPCDKTMDINPALKPDFCQDARNSWPLQDGTPPVLNSNKLIDIFHYDSGDIELFWPAILIDPPYTVPDAGRYQQYVKNAPPGAPPWEQVDMAGSLPSPAELLKRSWEVLRPGGKVGLLHQYHPKGPVGGRLVACIQVIQGAGQQPRCFTVWEKEWVGNNGWC